MGYIGRDNTFGTFDKQVLTPDSVETNFLLTYPAASASSLLVVYAGDVLEPYVDYNVITGGTEIELDFAPTTGLSLYIIFLGRPQSINQNKIEFESAFNPSSISSGASYSQEFTVSNAAVGDICAATLDTADMDGCTLFAYCNDANKVTAVVTNISGSGKDISSTKIYIDVWKRNT